jgi:hypothetical protein
VASVYRERSEARGVGRRNLSRAEAWQIMAEAQGAPPLDFGTPPEPYENAQRSERGGAWSAVIQLRVC